MPTKPLDPLISAGIPLVGTILNGILTGEQNRKNRAYGREMYDRQRQDSLNDWFMQNEYNSPASQMARLREAGLNPNLVYGNGATQSSQPVRSSTPQNYNPQAPQFDLNSVLGAYQDTMVKNAQIDNLKKQNTIMDEEKLLKKAQTIATLANAGLTGVKTDTAEFDLAIKSVLKETYMETAQANLERIRSQTQFTLAQNERAAAMNAVNIKQALERIVVMRAQVKESESRTNLNKAELPIRQNRLLWMDQEFRRQQEQINIMEKDGKLKELDIELKEKGVQPGDPIYFRIIARLLEEIKGNK